MEKYKRLVINIPSYYALSSYHSNYDYIMVYLKQSGLKNIKGFEVISKYFSEYTDTVIFEISVTIEVKPKLLFWKNKINYNFINKFKKECSYYEWKY